VNEKVYSIFNDIVDFIFPKTSIISGNNIRVGNSNQYINDDELFQLGRVTESDLTELKNKTISDESLSIFVFREGDEFSKIIYNLKYSGMKNLGIFLGRIMGDELINKADKIQHNEYDLLIPVPLFNAKQRERGYNQSEYLCKGLYERTKIKLNTDLLIRDRNTNSQTKLNRNHRILNVENAFSISLKHSDLLKDKKVIVVDDVITTGSTINEVIKTLKNSGAGKVFAFTLAMARE